ncbi:MAG: hypothetical protein CM1200mP20_02690 [Pseudomonadota bacterium]|nr:MAG: hypothetical protein CM1200mP20_02690 [Pseudomonadota bacterium]
MRGPGYLFWVFHAFVTMSICLARDPIRITGRWLFFSVIAGELEGASGDPHICICHADLRAANFIDDGFRLWLIDWEYGGFGNAWFDVGNMAAISGFERSAEARLLASYLEGEPTEADWRRFDALRCAANLREALWAMVSEQHLALESTTRLTRQSSFRLRKSLRYPYRTLRFRLNSAGRVRCRMPPIMRVKSTVR